MARNPSVPENSDPQTVQFRGCCHESFSVIIAWVSQLVVISVEIGTEYQRGAGIDALGMNETSSRAFGAEVVGCNA